MTPKKFHHLTSYRCKTHQYEKRSDVSLAETGLLNGKYALHEEASQNHYCDIGDNEDVYESLLPSQI